MPENNKDGSSMLKCCINHPKITGSIFFFLLTILSGVVVFQNYHLKVEKQKEEIENIKNIVEKNINQLFRSGYSASLTLALTLSNDGIPKEFEEVAASLLNSNKIIDGVQLVPEGIIQYVYPLEANEAALGVNIFEIEAAKEEAMIAKNRNEVFFAGPIELVQGGKAFVGRQPISLNGEFWGFSAVIIKLENLISLSGLEDLTKGKYFYQISKINPKDGKETFFLPNREDINIYSDTPITFDYGNWNLYIIPLVPYNSFIDILPLIIFGLLFSSVTGFFVTSILKKPNQLEQLVNIQTKKLEKSENQFKTIFEKAPLGVVLVNSEDRSFIKINQQYCKLLDYQEQEIMGWKFLEKAHQDDFPLVMAFIDKLKKKELKEFTLPIRYYTRLKALKWINLSISMVQDNEELAESYIAILEDITDKKSAEQELKASFELVEDQNKRLMNFSYIVSHNLRSHSSNFQSILSVLNSPLTESERKQFFNLLFEVSDSLEETLLNLNEVVSIRTKTNLNLEPLPISKYLDKVILILSEELKKKEVKLKLDVDEDAIINGNPAYLESILLNLVSNAVKFRHPQRRSEIEIRTYRENGSWSLEVEDNGIGMDLDKHGEELFGMYKRFTSRPDSRGLGLFITKSQIESMGGKIEVRSTLEEGTLFTVYFSKGNF